MQIDDISKRTGEWLRGEGPRSEVVISSRIRLARNLESHCFLSRADESERREIYRALTECILDAAGDECLVVNMDEADAIDRQILVERHLISKQHAEGQGCRGAVLWEDETRALMINEEDHLRIQCLCSGLQLDDLWQKITALDDHFDQRISFAYDDQYGYLTACPTNVGTGIRVSVMLHLPALKLTNEIERVFRAARDMHLAVRGLYGEGTDAIGDFFQISNQITLGKSEPEIINEFGNDIIPRIVDYELEARAALAKNRPYQLDDKIWRAYGVLANARTIGTEETLFMLSQLRLGVQMKRFKKVELATINELFLMTQRAHLQKRNGSTMDGEQRSIARAELLRDKLGNG
jgi:protein arginine kinase